MAEDKGITGTASEFLVLSALLRSGADATLTLGNKKKVDIVVNKDGKALTIDVKSLKGSGDFIVGKYEESIGDANHYYIFVYYADFSSVLSVPELFVVPATEIAQLVKQRSGVNNVSLKDLRDTYKSDAQEAMKIFVSNN